MTPMQITRVIIYISLMLGVTFSVQTIESNKRNYRAGLYGCGSGVVASVISGDILKLKSGRNVSIAGVKAPVLVISTKEKKHPLQSWPYADMAQQSLEKIALNKKVDFYCEGRRQDYRGRRVAHVFLQGNPEPIAFELLKNGALWAYPYNRQTKLKIEFYQYEDIARQHHIGLWQEEIYKPVSANEPNKIKAGEFKTVIGSIIKADKVGKVIFLNFGPNKYKDFTVKISPKMLAQSLKRKEIKFSDMPTLIGRQIIVRGWVESRGGPMIHVLENGRLRFLPAK